MEERSSEGPVSFSPEGIKTQGKTGEPRPKEGGLFQQNWQAPEDWSGLKKNKKKSFISCSGGCRVRSWSITTNRNHDQARS